MIVIEDRKTVRGTYCPFSRPCDQSCGNAYGAFCHIDDVYKERKMRAVLIAARKVINGDFENQPDEYNIEVAVLNQIDEALAMPETEQR